MRPCPCENQLGHPACCVRPEGRWRSGVSAERRIMHVQLLRSAWLPAKSGGGPPHSSTLPRVLPTAMLREASRNASSSLALLPTAFRLAEPLISRIVGRTILPLPQGEGRDEGETDGQFSASTLCRPIFRTQLILVGQSCRSAHIFQAWGKLI